MKPRLGTLCYDRLIIIFFVRGGSCKRCVTGGEIDPRRCKTSLLGESTGLSVPRSPVQFRQKLQKIENSKVTFEHIELRAKLPDYFLRSNKSNVNQYTNSCEKVREDDRIQVVHIQPGGLKPAGKLRMFHIILNCVKLFVKSIEGFPFLCLETSQSFYHAAGNESTSRYQRTFLRR